MLRTRPLTGGLLVGAGDEDHIGVLVLAVVETFLKLSACGTCGNFTASERIERSLREEPFLTGGLPVAAAARAVRDPALLRVRVRVPEGRNHAPPLVAKIPVG